MALLAKHLPARSGDFIRDMGSVPGSGRPPGEGNFLAWKIPWSGGRGRLQSMGSQNQMLLK